MYPSQCLFFRRKDDARAQLFSLRLVKRDGNQISLFINQPDWLIFHVHCFRCRSDCNAVPRSSRILTR